MHWACAEKGGHITSKVEAQKPRSGTEGQLTDGTFNKLQNYYGVTVRENMVNLAGMKIIKKKPKKSHPCQSHALCFPRVPPYWQHKLVQVPARHSEQGKSL